MTAQLLTGKEIGLKLRGLLAEKISEFNSKHSERPISLLTVQFGSASDASLYSKAIGRMCSSLGIVHSVFETDRCANDAEAIELIRAEKARILPTGILLLSPIPDHLNYRKIIASIPANFDAEGTRYEAAAENNHRAYPPTALAVFETILAAERPIEGLNAVVVGRSKIVGKPVADLLLSANATVTICHSKTKNLEQHIRNADIVVAAVGSPALIKGDWIKPGAIVSDAGENVVNDTPVGDVDFEAAQKVAGYITPVPQGVGPLTTLMLAKNLLALANNQSG
ncbi:MAG: bifunctional 5,10-methylenetetrahydrofolate dehydrogenase/5,10-methenyltetrahydrofolate cyclohydrolase [Candidatus Omnitrophica bacterium]|nr:bifunctional 5,10-methylenetetrahydrofolate dehydrogenase/5,10-methenyltetrahydrofolate cyclohydrolase [Candidatus Omnitrophota bacterium]